MTDEARTAEERTQDFTAMGHSVDLINDIVAGNQDDDMEADERQDAVDRNVEHLQIMVAKDDWDDEDMTASNAAITSGQELHGQLIYCLRWFWFWRVAPLSMWVTGLCTTRSANTRSFIQIQTSDIGGMYVVHTDVRLM